MKYVLLLAIVCIVGCGNPIDQGAVVGIGKELSPSSSGDSKQPLTIYQLAIVKKDGTYETVYVSNAIYNTAIREHWVEKRQYFQGSDQR